MSAVQTTLFKPNKTQAVRLPKAVELPATEKKVEVIAIGNTRIIVPAGESWDSWFDRLDVTADFITDREQPEDQIREGF